jgi:hypothetical protein
MQLSLNQLRKNYVIKINFEIEKSVLRERVINSVKNDYLRLITVKNKLPKKDLKNDYFRELNKDYKAMKQKIKDLNYSYNYVHVTVLCKKTNKKQDFTIDTNDHSYLRLALLDNNKKRFYRELKIILKEKIQNKNFEKFGHISPFGNKEIQKNIIDNKIYKISQCETFFNGYTYNTDLFKIYRRKVRYKTDLLRVEIFKNWNGYDYYDGEYIKDNFYLDKNYQLSNNRYEFVNILSQDFMFS